MAIREECAKLTNKGVDIDKAFETAQNNTELRTKYFLDSVTIDTNSEAQGLADVRSSSTSSRPLAANRGIHAEKQKERRRRGLSRRLLMV